MPVPAPPREADANERVSVAQLQHALDVMPFATLMLCPSGTVAYANSAAEKHWNICKNSRLEDHLHAADRPLLQHLLSSFGKNLAQPAPLELRFVRDGFPLRYALVTHSGGSDVVAAESGLLLLQLADISAQKQTEDELAEHECRWNQALVSSALGVWDHNFRLGTKFYSETWHALRGMNVNQQGFADKESWLQAIHPEDRAHVLHAIERQNAGDPKFAIFEYRERHSAGHWIWIECRGACVEWDENGVATRVIGTDTDITQRKSAEQELEQLSRRLQLVLDVSQIGVFEADLENGETYWDARMFEIYGLDRPDTTPAELHAMWLQLLHPDDRLHAQNTVEQNLDQPKPFSDQYRIMRPDGSHRHVRTRALPYLDASGQKRLIGADWDVTEDVLLHQELQRAKNLAEARNIELEAARARIEHDAMHDHLTGLPNRRYLDKTLDGFSARSSSDGIAILHIDLNRFKQINDTLGHRAGDTMLKHAAGILTANLKANEVAARIGGDQFVVLAHFDGSHRKLANLANRIIQRLRKPVAYEGVDCRLGASIGIASETGAEIDAVQLLLKADIALYNAKKRGRNLHEFFSLDTQNLLINIKRVSDGILRGLEANEFAPYYQPQFDAQTLDISGVESLARWLHPKRGVLSPDKFLAVAEDLDVVAAIDELIFEKAHADFLHWQSLGLGIPRLSVNVSSRRLHDPGLTKKLNGMRIEPGTVSFELLETIFLDDCDDEVLANLARLRKFGIDIEIDDFGTGHASIVSLMRLNPSTLKIDRELVRLLPQSPEQRKLVGSIIEIGKSLDIKVIAEGVETADHIRILRDLGCDMLQGYALAKPMPPSEIEAFVRSQRWRQHGYPVRDLMTDLKRRIQS
jgi:diguanylate cyclase (GGDEF)-like protein/PAS domain S-box-containing protein